MSILKKIQTRFDSISQAIDIDSRVQAMGKVANRLDGIANAITGMGYAGDKTTASRPVKSRNDYLTIEEIRHFYTSNGYAKKFVRIIPDSALRFGWYLGESTEPLNEDVDQRLEIPDRVGTAIVEARKFGGAFMILIHEDFKERSSLPVSVASGEVRNIIVPDVNEVEIQEWVADPLDQSYQCPRLISYRPYTMSVGIESSGDMWHGGYVHESRFVYVPGERLSAFEALGNPIKVGFDQSVLQHVWKKIVGKETVEHASTLLAGECKINVIQVGDLAGIQTMDDQEGYFLMRMRLLAQGLSNLGLVILGDNENFQTISNTITGFKELDEVQARALCAVLDIPQTIFFMDAPSGLNTDGASGSNNWHTKLEGWQTSHVNRVLMHLYFRLRASGQIQFDDDVSLNWWPLNVESDSEKSARKLVDTQSDVAYIMAGVLTPEHVAESRFGGDEYGVDIKQLGPIEEDDGGELEAIKALMAAGVEEAPAGVPPQEARTPAVVDGAETGVADTAMNGAQVSSMVEIVQSIASALLPADSGKAILMKAFQLSPEEADAIVGSAGTNPAPPPEPAPMGPVEVAVEEA